jgi:hypothetical protein
MARQNHAAHQTATNSNPIHPSHNAAATTGFAPVTFSKYAPGAKGPLAGDFFVPDEVFEKTDTKVARTFG